MVDSKTHWQNIYQNKSSHEVSWYQENPALSLELIHCCKLSKTAPVIDIGGGASLLIDHLCKEDYSRLAVLDISENALSISQNRLGDCAKNIEWFISDITHFSPPHTFSLWHDRAVFHFLTAQEDRNRYISALKKALVLNGHIIIAAFAIGGPEKCSDLEIVQYSADKLSTELGSDFKLIETRDEAHITPSDKEQKFTYYHFLRIC